MHHLSHCLTAFRTHVALHYKAELPEPFSEVYVRNINCFDPIEKLYYSAGYTPIYIYCAEEVEVDVVSSEFYPQCLQLQKVTE